MAWNQRMSSGWAGAAVVIRTRARSRPSSWRRIAPTCQVQGSVEGERRPGHRRAVLLVSHLAQPEADVALHSGTDREPLGPHVALYRFAELLPHPGHGQEHGRPARRQVLGDRGEAAGEPGLAGHGYRHEVAHHPLGDVAERQERQEAVALADVVDRGDVAQRPHDVRVS